MARGRPCSIASRTGHSAGTGQIVLILGVGDPTPRELRDFRAGFELSVFGEELTLLGDGDDLPETLPDARGDFSGFVELRYPLPDDTRNGFWLIIECAGYAPPVHLPQLFVDDVRVQ